MSLAPPGEDENLPAQEEDAGEDTAGEYTAGEDAGGATDAGDRTETRPAWVADSARRPAHSSRRGLRDRVATHGERIRTLSITALVNIVVIAILAGALVFTLLHFNGDNESSLRSSALAAAKTYGVELSSYNYKNLNGPGSPWARVESHATAKFRKDFASTSADLAKLLNQYNATATGKVIDAGVETVSGSKAIVVLFIDQSVTNSVQKPNSVTQPLRVRLTMLRQNGQWLIDNLEVPK
ncbi:MAG TPA: hypothetical protein VNF71_06205 [Acidimicrobiales bacterium]|nr:hypothetical protein [Acidimicrobiales bacterium]